MKTFDRVIALGVVLTLGLASVVIYRAHQQNRGNGTVALPSVHAPPPSIDSFPTCRAIADATRRTQCEVAVAQRRGQVRCAGGRLYYIRHDAEGKVRYNPWPASFSCWNQVSAGTAKHSASGE